MAEFYRRQHGEEPKNSMVKALDWTNQNYSGNVSSDDFVDIGISYKELMVVPDGERIKKLRTCLEMKDVFKKSRYP